MSSLHADARANCKCSGVRSVNSQCQSRMAYHQSFPGWFLIEGFLPPSLSKFVLGCDYSRSEPFQVPNWPVSALLRLLTLVMGHVFCPFPPFPRSGHEVCSWLYHIPLQLQGLTSFHCVSLPTHSPCHQMSSIYLPGFCASSYRVL